MSTDQSNKYGLSQEQMSDLGKSIKTDFDLMRKLMNGLVDTAIKKDNAYGASWKARGGPGAYFTIVRKPDRLEAQLKKVGYNFFDISVDPEDGESIDETLRDAICYYALVLTTREMMRNALSTSKTARSTFKISNSVNPLSVSTPNNEASAEATSGYVDQDRDR